MAESASTAVAIESPPVCSCHGVAQRWHRDPRPRAGGYWECRVRKREHFRRWRAANLVRERERERHWRKKNPEKARERDRRRREANSERMREYDVTRRHGITREQRDAMYEAQGRACAGCLTPMPDRDLQIDHDHGCCPGGYSCGECVRGLVCRTCNARDVLGKQVA